LTDLLLLLVNIFIILRQTRLAWNCCWQYICRRFTRI